MCELTAGYTKKCDVAGGVDKIHIFPVKDGNGVSTIASYTVAAGEVTALTLVSGKKAWTFNIEPETANFEAPSSGEAVAGSAAYTHTSNVTLHGSTAADGVLADQLVKGRHAVIHQMADGTYELLHMTNGGKAQVTRQSGTAYEDMNGRVVALTSKEKAGSVKISSVIVASLLEVAS
jgi:hypothetical protein